MISARNLQALSGGGMEVKRRDDLEKKTRFRSDRIIEHRGKWFFHTREGTIEGPFEDQLEASCQVKIYFEKMTLGLQSADGELSLEPLELTRLK